MQSVILYEMKEKLTGLRNLTRLRDRFFYFIYIYIYFFSKECLKVTGVDRASCDQECSKLLLGISPALYLSTLFTPHSSASDSSEYPQTTCCCSPHQRHFPVHSRATHDNCNNYSVHFPKQKS